MIAFTRADNTFVARWWVTVDRWTLGALFVLVGCGYIMVLAASPAVAERIHASREMFIVKQLVFLALSLASSSASPCCRRGWCASWRCWAAAWRWPPPR